MRVHCEKTSLYTTFWLTCMCSHENVLIEAHVCIQLFTQFPMLCSTDMFLRSVSTTRHIHVRVHTLKDGCLYTFLTYEVWPMRNVKHYHTLFSHNFPQMQSKQSTKSQLFNLRTLLTMQLLTYKDVSVRKSSDRRTCLCATYHVIFYVLSRPPCFHAVCWLPDVFMRMFAHQETGVCTLFDLWSHVYA